MNRELFLYAGLPLLGVFLGAVSQVMLKKAALKNYPSKLKEYLNPLVVTAYVIFVGTTLISVYAYRVVPLSLGPILEATGYIYVTIFGIAIFRENINIRKISGLLLIIAGITVYALLG